MNITLTKIQEDILKQYAEGNSLTIEEYATNILTGWINGHMKGYYKTKMEEESASSLKQKYGAFKVRG